MKLELLAIALLVIDLIIMGSLLGRRRRAISSSARRKEAQMANEVLQYQWRGFG